MNQSHKFLVRHSQKLSGLGLAVLTTVGLVPHTLMLKKYRSVVEQLKDSQPEPIDDHVQALLDKVNFHIKLPVEHEAAIEQFVCFGNDMLHMGSVYMRSGALIGIPSSFKYQMEDDVKRDKMMVNRVAVDWDSPPGQRLASALLLSDNAKKFAYAREIMHVNSHYVWSEAGIHAFCGFGAYYTGFLLNRTLRLKSILKTWARVSLYTMIGSMWLLVCVLLKDMYYCHQDNKVDKRAAKLGVDYAEGGVEYYTKLLKRNQALREIMGAEGQFLYTPYGNRVATWRTPTVQLSTRRDNLIKYRQEYKK